MKRLFAFLVLAMAAAIAFALPRPAQIEDALAAQKYDDAKGMIAEVLRERPDSARAHLLNSYVLVHVDRNAVAAVAELETAKGLDKRGDVKSSPLFGRVVAEIDALPRKQAPSAKPAEKRESGFQMVLVALILVGAASVLLYLLFRRKPAPDHCGAVGWSDDSDFGSGVRRSPPRAPSGGSSAFSAPIPHPVFYPVGTPQPVQQQPMGPLGTAASVAGGVVAGNAISDMIRSRSGGHRDDDWEESRRKRERESSSSTDSSSSYTAPPVSYESERSSFSSGSSDSWSSSSSSSDSSSSSSSSDWGSSSSDSGSSSSSDW